MGKRVLYGFVVMLMYLVGSGFSQGEAEWERILSEAQQLILLTLTSSLCGVPCAIVKDQVAQLAKTNGNHIIFYNANILEKPFFARLYKVLKVPTLIVFKGGKEIKRLDNDFYWGSVYDLVFKSDIFYSAPSPSASAPSPSDSAPPPFEPWSSWSTSIVIQSFVETNQDWGKTLDQAEHPIVVMVTSSLCGAPCATLEHQVVQLAKTYGDQIIFYKNNILENPFFAKLYNVLNVPTVIVFKDGKVYDNFRYEYLSDWGAVYDLISRSSIFGSALPPSDSDDALPLAPQSGN